MSRVILMTLATFIIPIAPYHTDIAQQAIESAQAQTIPCTIISAVDHHEHGPSYIRNRALEHTTTDFVVFLDADDWVEPTFVADCLAVWQPDHYVYTDWHSKRGVVSAPDHPWWSMDGDTPNWHPVTTFLPLKAARLAGGFDNLPVAEDSEFYWRLTRVVKCCGIPLHKPLFHYGPGGQRSAQGLFADEARGVLSQDYRDVKAEINRRYRNMGCCGGGGPTEPSPEEGEEGDVLAQAIWRGNQARRGPKTGRLYPRAGNGKWVMVAPEDAQAAPQWWRVGGDQERPEPPRFMANRPETIQANGFAEMTRLFEKHFLGIHQRKPTLQELEQVAPATVAPDIEAITALTRGIYGE